MRVLLFSRYTRLGASSRLRSYQYIPYLEKLDIQVDIEPLFTTTYLENLYSKQKRNTGIVLRSYLDRACKLMLSGRYDLLWIEYELFPWLPAFAEILLSLRKIPYVVDYDDAIFHRYDAHHNSLVRKMLGRKIDRVMSHAALVIAGNDYLARRAVLAGARQVALIPTVVDLEKYTVKKADMPGRFVIGWIGSPSTSEFLKVILPVLTEVCKQRDLAVQIVGDAPEFLHNLPVQFLSWEEDAEVNSIQQFDVGIMPLPDTHWAKGKCGYKLIQYMACGLPVIASPVGANTAIVRHEENGFLADTHAEWIRYILRLRDDRSARNRLGMNGRRTVEQKYSLQVTAPRVADLLMNRI